VHTTTKRTSTVSAKPAKIDVRLLAEPASQGAFAAKYFLFVEAKHIDNANVLLPVIVNRNMAIDSPLHLVSKFFTVGRCAWEEGSNNNLHSLTDLWYASAH
jgi:hypothetical protein